MQSVIGGEFDLLAAADFIDVDDRSNITHGKPASPAIINLLGRVAFGARAGALGASNCNGWARSWGWGRDAKGTGEDDVSGAGSS